MPISELGACSGLVFNRQLKFSIDNGVDLKDEERLVFAYSDLGTEISDLKFEISDLR
jgi:hypothetical protein